METELSNTSEQRRPDGWPRWLWALVRIFVDRGNRLALEEPSQLAQTAHNLGKKVKALRESEKEWRERAFSAERVVHHELREAIKEACRRHDREHGTTLHFGI